MRVILNNGRHWHKDMPVRIVKTRQPAVIVELYPGMTARGDRASLKLSNGERDVKLIAELEQVA